MTTFVERNSTHLGTDRIFTSPTATALYENLLSLAEGQVLGATGFYGLGAAKLTSGAVAAASSLDIPLDIYTNYRHFLVVLDSFVPATDAVNLCARVSTDGGASFLSAANYTYGFKAHNSSNADGSGGSATNTLFPLGINQDNAVATGGLGGLFWIFDPSNNGKRGIFAWETGAFNSDLSAFWSVRGHGLYNVAQDTTDIRFLESAGNITQGNWALYGFK